MKLLCSCPISKYLFGKNEASSTFKEEQQATIYLVFLKSKNIWIQACVPIEIYLPLDFQDVECLRAGKENFIY